MISHHSMNRWFSVAIKHKLPIKMMIRPTSSTTPCTNNKNKIAKSSIKKCCFIKFNFIMYLIIWATFKYAFLSKKNIRNLKIME